MNINTIEKETLWKYWKKRIERYPRSRFEEEFKTGRIYNKGKYSDSGYFYAPYIPISVTPVIYDPNKLKPTDTFYRRYGKKWKLNKWDIIKRYINNLFRRNKFEFIGYKMDGTTYVANRKNRKTTIKKILEWFK